MTQDEFVALAPRVSFRGGVSFWMPDVRIEPLPDGGVRVLVLKAVPDRSVAKPDQDPLVLINQMARILSSYGLTAKELARSTVEVGIRRLMSFVRESMTHEVDESICFDDQLAEDMHRGDPVAPDYAAFAARFNGPLPTAGTS